MTLPLRITSSSFSCKSKVKNKYLQFCPQFAQNDIFTPINASTLPSTIVLLFNKLRHATILWFIHITKFLTDLTLKGAPNKILNSACFWEELTTTLNYHTGYPQECCFTDQGSLQRVLQSATNNQNNSKSC